MEGHAGSRSLAANIRDPFRLHRAGSEDRFIGQQWSVMNHIAVMRPDGDPAKKLDLAIRAADKRLLRLGSTLQSKGSSKISLDQLCPQCPASSGDLSGCRGTTGITLQIQQLPEFIYRDGKTGRVQRPKISSQA